MTNNKNTRRRGRPAASSRNLVDKPLIINCAYGLARSEPLHEISIVRVARELGVTPALLHYYIDGREALTSGVMNAFYCDLVQYWPQPTGDWKSDIESLAQYVYEAYLKYPGIAAYVVSHNKFRLVQIVDNTETDYGVIVFEKTIATFRQAGFDAEHTAMWAHLFMEFVASSAFSRTRHRSPGEHSQFLDQALGSLDKQTFPNAHFIRKAYVRYDADKAFREALRLMLNGLKTGMERTSKSAR